MTQTELTIAVQSLPHAQGLTVLHRATEGASGYDLVAAIAESVTIKPTARTLVPCGFSLTMPIGMEAQVRPRSGLALHYGITVLNSPGTIDSDYRGEIKVILINHGTADFTINRGERIAQLVFAQSLQPKFTTVVLDPKTTLRGELGFGSTGMARMGEPKTS
ncbi:MAG: dUTP diphosphatase [Candidatus Pacebacteria bacterium]|nr:dUTP diphosphatase [Candidatus Paceibacterota bacterium]